MSETSFKAWLLAEIRQSLGAKSANHLVLWCDRELLRGALASVRAPPPV